MHGIVTFPGVDQILRATCTLGHGVVPSVCVLEMVPQAATFADVGTLTFQYGDATVVLPECKADMATARLNEEGLVWQVSILDRRWKWVFGQVWGEFNSRDDGGQLIADFVAAPQELATFLLNVAGEIGFDVSQLPNDTRPHVEWVGANPMTELERLCHELSCRVVLHLDNTVSIEPLGVGAALPDLPSIMENSLSIDPPNQPDSIVVFGDRTVVQTRIPLEAVGKDLDDSIVPIDDLSYTPADGWEFEPACMSNVAEADGARQRALETVFRWYRLKIDADNLLDIAPLELTIANRALVLPLLSELAEWTTDAEGRRITRRPAVFGIYSPQALPSDETDGLPHNSDDFEEFAYKGTFAVDLKRGLVQFAEPVRRFNSTTDGWLPAELWLECAFHIRHPDLGSYARWTWQLDMPGDPHGTGPEVIERVDELQASFRMVPTTLSSGNPAGVTTTWDDNIASDDLEVRSLEILDAAALRYTVPEAAGTVSYAELVPIDLDGAIHQVTYRVDETGTTTTAGRNTEHDPFVPPYERRRLPRAERAAGRRTQIATRDMRKDASRGTRDGGSLGASNGIGAGWLEFFNDSGETVPAHAAMRASGMRSVDGRGVLEMSQPDSSAAQAIYFNGPVDVAEEAYGMCTRDVPLVVLYDTAEGTPDPGETFDILADSWKLAQRRPGPFVVQGVLDDSAGLALVGRPDLAAAQSTGLVRVLNQSGSTVSRFGVLVLDGPFYDPTDPDEFERFAQWPPAVKGIFPDPDEPAHVGNFCVTQEEILSGEWGLAIVSGITPVLVAINGDASVTHADIDASNDNLASRPSRLSGSALILWKEDPTATSGVMWSLVRLSNPTEPPPGCGEKPLEDKFDDGPGTTLDNHIMDHGCGWLQRAGTITDLVADASGLQFEAVTGTQASVYTFAQTPNSNVLLDFTAGTCTAPGTPNVSVSVILRLKSVNTFWFANAFLLTGGNGHLDIIEKTNGTNTTRATQTGLMTPFAAQYSLVFSDNGNNMIAALTGGVTASCTHSSIAHASGTGVGFGHTIGGIYTTQSKFRRFLCT